VISLCLDKKDKRDKKYFRYNDKICTEINNNHKRKRKNKYRLEKLIE